MFEDARNILLAHLVVGLPLCAWGLGGFVIGAFVRSRGARHREKLVSIGQIACMEHVRLRGRVLSIVIALAGVLLCSRGMAIHATIRKPRMIATDQVWFIAMLALACLAIGAALLFKRNKHAIQTPRCPKCLFDLSHLTALGSDVHGKCCTECGREIRSLHDLFQSPLSKRMKWLAIATPLLAYTTFALDRIEKHGVSGFVPTTAMIAGFEVLPESLIIGRGLNPPYSHSLIERHVQGELWSWQTAWLESTAEQSMQSPADIHEMWRALSFVDKPRKELTLLQRDSLLDAMVSTDTDVGYRGRQAFETFGWRRHSLYGTRERFKGHFLRDYLKEVITQGRSDRKARLDGMGQGRAADLLAAWRVCSDDCTGFALIEMAGTDFDTEWSEVRSHFASKLDFQASYDYLVVLAAIESWTTMAAYSEPARRDLLAAIGGPDPMVREVLRVAVDRDGPDSVRSVAKERDAAMHVMQDPARSLAERLGAARTLGKLGPCVESENAVRFLLISGLDWELAERDEIAAIAGKLTPPKQE